MEGLRGLDRGEVGGQGLYRRKACSAQGIKLLPDAQMCSIANAYSVCSRQHQWSMEQVKTSLALLSLAGADYAALAAASCRRAAC